MKINTHTQEIIIAWRMGYLFAQRIGVDENESVPSNEEILRILQSGLTEQLLREKE